jgi:hypothetical protein
MAATEELRQGDSQHQSDVPLLQQPSVVQKAEALLSKLPGLRGYMEKRVDMIWEKGVDAIYEGELYLELFSPRELEAGLGVLRTGLGLAFNQEVKLQDAVSRKASEAQAKAIISGIDAYITELFTPQRLDQLRAQLNTILNREGWSEEWQPFVFMLARYMAAEDAAEAEKPFLVRALLGEMRTVVAVLKENHK